MTRQPPYLMEDGRVSLAITPASLDTSEELEHYIDCITADLEAMKLAHLDRISVRKVSVFELHSDLARRNRLELFRSLATRQLRAIREAR